MNTTENPPTTDDPPDLGRITTTSLFRHRILILDRELDEANGAQLCSALLLLAAEDPDRDVTLLINSPGGLVPAMLAIGDLMDLVPCDVRTVGLGMAYSAGQYLLTHGTPGKRMILPHGTVLMHQGSAGFGGSAPDIALQAEDLRRNRDLVIEVTAQRTGQRTERIAADSERDKTWQAQEAVDYGFCDHVVTDLATVLPLPYRTRRDPRSAR
jgi:ATP-dependent Clp protease protease subunit